MTILPRKTHILATFGSKSVILCRFGHFLEILVKPAFTVVAIRWFKRERKGMYFIFSSQGKLRSHRWILIPRRINMSATKWFWMKKLSCQGWHFFRHSKLARIQFWLLCYNFLFSCLGYPSNNIKKFFTQNHVCLVLRKRLPGGNDGVGQQKRTQNRQCHSRERRLYRLCENLVTF